jgi:hypothetical protein
LWLIIKVGEFWLGGTDVALTKNRRSSERLSETKLYQAFSVRSTPAVSSLASSSETAVTRHQAVWCAVQAFSVRCLQMKLKR